MKIKQYFIAFINLCAAKRLSPHDFMEKQAFAFAIFYSLFYHSLRICSSSYNSTLIAPCGRICITYAEPAPSALSI